MKKYLLIITLSFGLLLVAGQSANASEVTGNLTTGLESGIQGVVITAPTATPGAGTYTSIQNVALSANGSNSIHYTTNGSDPTCTTGGVYASTISVGSSLTIKAISCYPNNVASSVSTNVYVINLPPSEGGAGGGGGVPLSTPPTETSIIINGGSPSTDVTQVTLTLSALGASQMAISNTADFSTVGFETYSTSKQWQLLSGDGLKTVYAKFRAASGDMSSPVSDTITLNTNTPRVLGEVASGVEPHPNGTLVLDGLTIYLIQGGQRRGFRNPGEFFSHGYSFAQAVNANAGDRALPTGPVMKALEGTLALDKSDGRTVYMVGLNGTKRGFVSADVFGGLGYSFAGIAIIDLGDYVAGANIASATEAHPEGALVLNSGTIWWIRSGARQGFQSTAVFDSYDFKFSRAVAANVADMALPEGALVKFRDGTLVKQGDAIYIISDGNKRLFTSMTALTSRGYKSSNAIVGNVSSYASGASLD